MPTLKVWTTPPNTPDGPTDTTASGDPPTFTAQREDDAELIEGDAELWTELRATLPNPSLRAVHAQADPYSPAMLYDLRDHARAQGHRAEVEGADEPPAPTGDSPAEFDLFMAEVPARFGRGDGRGATVVARVPAELAARWIVQGAQPQSEEPAIVLFSLGDTDPSEWTRENLRARLAVFAPLRLRYGVHGAWGLGLTRMAAAFDAKPLGRIEYEPVPDAGEVALHEVEVRGLPEELRVPLGTLTPT